MAMQGSSISNCDVGGATIKLNDDGFYVLNVGAADMGTGSDTVLAQIASEVLECNYDNVVVFSADTDTSPYDSGSYASSTTYLTGKAVEQACIRLRESIQNIGAALLKCDVDVTEFDGEYVYCLEEESEGVSLKDIATASMFNNGYETQFTSSARSSVSPPPYMTGMV